MAKKQKAYAHRPDKFPARQCPECSKWYHARAKQCPECGAENPTRASATRRVKRVKVKRQRVLVAQNHGSPLEHAISFVEAAGGVDAAKSAIETLERARTLPR